VRTAIALGERHRKEDGPGPHAPAYDAEDVMNAISLELSDELFERAIHEVYVNAYARRKRND
jgi:hypothetical protein